MAGFIVEVDPEGAPYVFSEANGIYLLGPLKSPMSQAEQQMASNVDSEGEQSAGSREKNTEITAKLRLVGSSAKEFQERQLRLEQKVDKLRREGGVLRIHYPAGSWIDWEIRGITGGDRLLDNSYIANWRTEDELTFICAPFGKGQEVLVGEYEFGGEAKRVLECVVDDLDGSAPALARAEVSSAEGDIWDLLWGRESARYSEAATAKCGYGATALTPLGGAVSTTATIEGKAGVSVIQGTLTPNWTAQLSTQLAGVGHLTHAGVYEVTAWVSMPTANTGEVGIAFEYAVSGLTSSAKRTLLDPVYFPADHAREGRVIKLVVGQVFIDPVGRGSHFWEGRFLARSTIAGDKLQILDVGLRPLVEGNGQVTVSPALNQPAALLTRDEFPQTGGGALNGKALAAAETIVGPKTPATVTGFTNGSNVGSSDDNWATAELNAGANASLTGSQFGFAIPETATIIGIVARVERHQGGAAEETSETFVSLRKAGVNVGSNYASLAKLPTSDVVAQYGGPTDLWGTTWTPADINNSGFGLIYGVHRGTGVPAGSKGTAYIDQVTVTVYYAPSGGQTWATSGDPVDLSVDESVHAAKRTEVGDASVTDGRYAIAGTTVTADVVVGIKAKHQALSYGGNGFVWGAALARYVDQNNWLALIVGASVSGGAVEGYVQVSKRVGGTYSKLNRFAVPDSSEYRSIWLQVDSRGRYFGWAILTEGGAPRLLLAGQDPDLAEGGALDDGKNGFYDVRAGSEANTRYYDQFVVWVPPLDAVIYQGQKLELTSDACRREVLGAGGTWVDVVPRGDYLKLSPAGLENRKNRLVFIASPNDPETMGVGFPKKLKVAVYATPRYRTVPQPV